ncbi:Two-component response regulator-like APRR2 [Hibiscus syriacus]|uniref:Two-component response regulator-like APRR2 n=1 Tax=Hibiscus syriacus TaxID=106335 RepID=A0A6A3CA73_HIBSY|nr:two-component response regulator-like APRR2 [Hibiscus syriacus]XP_039058588.1 two-component response regulator-like APRR2 [Hibiscus syriacus]KAE8725646.1 Two-component response regulator-like APRR2 [Hibiscus syriacus]
MVYTADDLSTWKDFPKGLKVLLLDEDAKSAAELKSKLEAMDYIVHTFCNENEAISAVSSKPESFHVAIVEVSTNNNNGGFKFLETVKDLPTIMTSNIHCISTMMKCIALGAVEFLRKPLSEEKLRNLWQHVVHKAFNAAGKDISESLKPVKKSLVSMLHLQLKSGEAKNEDSVKTEYASVIHENDPEPSTASDKYSAPSKPQLEQRGSLLADGDCQDNTHCSTEKESYEQGGESKSVETTSDNTIAEVTAPVGQPQGPRETTVREEADLVDGTKGESTIYSQTQNGVNNKDSDAVAEIPNTVSGIHSSCPNKANRKKMKVDWSPELHKKFVQAVDQLGIDQAIPSRVLELMKVEGLTRHNVASHLQKYRMNRRHIFPKEDDRRRPQRDQMRRSCYPHKPIMAFPPHYSNHVVPVGPPYPMWGPPPHPSSIQMWGSQGYPPWQPTENWHWKPYPLVHADAWGCPVFPPPLGYCSTFTQNASVFHCSGTVDNRSGMPQNTVEHQPAEEVVDKVVKEAINKPWLPLPLGLKPPSTDSVLAELSKQGISTIPPHIDGRNLS